MAHSSPVVFGPVPSRRLGRSLGINHVLGKTCSYSCVYCQVGRTRRLTIERQAFRSVDTIERAVGRRLAVAVAGGERVDYLSFVTTGEPTLDIHLGDAVRRLRRFGIRIAVVTNASLLWRPDVRDDLQEADWVSVKVDAAVESTWRRVNRPHGRLSFTQTIEGLLAFGRECRRTLATETMIVAGVNDGVSDLSAVADLLGSLGPKVAYLSAPTRPPAEAWVHPPDPAILASALDILGRRVPAVRCLYSEEDGEFSGSGDAVTALLATAAVHPLRQDVVDGLLRRGGCDARTLARLVESKRLTPIVHRDQVYYRSGATNAAAGRKE
jgi:wyosine [tRNA(Phe)-imidazoG37] synthetase (radical SAM superfamily)